MSDFINTIDVLGDDAVMDSLIERSITEFKDDQITSVGTYAFCHCTELENVDLPSVVLLGDYAFNSCTKLTTVNLPNTTNGWNNANYVFTGCTALKNVYLPTFDTGSSNNIKDMFSNCTSLTEISLPALTNVGFRMFRYCSSLKKVELGSATFIHQGFVQDCPQCCAVIVRTNTLCSLAHASDCFSGTKIASGTGYIYVPADLIDSYKMASNWSNYATQFRAIEDYSVDGTVTGDMREYCRSISLDVTELTFSDANSQTLTPIIVEAGVLDQIEWSSGDNKIATVDNNGVVTPRYDGTTTITVTCGEHSASCVVTVNAGLERPLYDLELTPYNGSEEGELPVGKLDVAAETKLEITYYLTKKQGYVWDGRKCGLQYQLNNNVIGVETTITVDVPSNGIMVFSGNNANDYNKTGQLASSAADRLYGKYLRVKFI